MAIRSHAPWWVKLLVAAGVMALALAAARGIYDAGRGWVGFDVDDMRAEVVSLRERLIVMDAELASMRQRADSAHSSLQIERTAQEQLAARIRSLESENARLREDALIFESLAGAGARGIEQGFKINRLLLEPDGEAGRYRYRMLIVRQGGKADVDTRGSYQIVASIDRAGEGATITFPPDAGAENSRLIFRHFQRVDGVLVIPKEAKLLSIEARFLQDGQIRARATASL